MTVHDRIIIFRVNSLDHNAGHQQVPDGHEGQLHGGGVNSVGQGGGALQQEALAPAHQAATGPHQGEESAGEILVPVNRFYLLRPMQDKLITIYQEFIVDFESRIDPLSLVMIAQCVMER